ncbi:MAG: hypothetical protein AAGF28_07525 [Pseudomonadota bacterium]
MNDERRLLMIRFLRDDIESYLSDHPNVRFMNLCLSMRLIVQGIPDSAKWFDSLAPGIDKLSRAIDDPKEFQKAQKECYSALDKLEAHLRKASAVSSATSERVKSANSRSVTNANRFELLDQVRDIIDGFDGANWPKYSNQISRMMLRITAGLPDQAEWCDRFMESSGLLWVNVTVGGNGQDFKTECHDTLDQLEKVLFDRVGERSVRS